MISYLISYGALSLHASDTDISEEVHQNPMSLSGGEDRWDRSQRVGWIDLPALRRSRCLVVGAGALGNEAVKNLVLSGAGSVTVVDMDHVELSNLNRCLFFRDGDAAAGLAKSEVLAQRAAELSPGCRVEPMVSALEDADLDWGGFDLALGCLDNVKARLHLNAHCRRHRLPYVDAGTDGSRGKLQVVLADGPCLQCSMNSSHYRVMERRFSCTGGDHSYYEPPMAAEISTTAAMAALQAREGLKILSSREDACVRHMLFYDGMGASMMLELDVDRDCPNHGDVV